MFVVQKHDASRLHYDFRLELGGVLLSWAVPRGPSLDPSDKRLAVRTEDHPLEYGDFEGVIPEGEYGGGSVIVWDRGTWTAEGDPHEGLERGRLTFDLAGDKLRGRFHLIRTRGRGGGGAGRDNWLLFKGADEQARRGGGDALVEQAPRSVLSGRTVEEVADHPRRVHLPAAVALSHPDKVLFPEQGLTKAALAGYYATVADWILPHLADRPLTLVRCPEGQGAHCFYQKHATRGVPEAITRVPIRERTGRRGAGEPGREATYMAVRDTGGLLSLVQLGALEIHTWGCRRDRIERPDLLVFDLDPDEALPWDAVIGAALALRERLGDLGLECFAKTTGGKGLHVVVPIERRSEWGRAGGFARGVATRMAADQPDRYVATMSRARRAGKVFVDYLRNSRGATFVCPYSTRARARAPVATPVTWDEVERGVVPADFTVATVPARLASLRGADPWAGMASVRQSITVAMRRAVGAEE